MYDSFKKGFKIQVGVRFDSHMEGLIEYVKSFSRRTGAKIRLVHAVEEWKEHPWLTTYPGEGLFTSVARVAEEQAKTEADARMKEVVDSLSDFDVESNVVVGSAADVLMADALSSGCALSIVTMSQSHSSYKFLPKGFSTALSLMNGSRIPVLIVPDKYMSFDNGKRTKLIYADDLTDHSANALSLALEMAHGFGNVDFHQVHVCEIPREDIQEANDRVFDLMALAHIPFEGAFKDGHFAETLKDHALKKMEARVGSADTLLTTSDGQIERDVFLGEVDTKMKSYVEEISPDLIVFGRHEFFRSWPFVVGRLPFWAMLALGKPVVIAPNRR